MSTTAATGGTTSASLPAAAIGSLMSASAARWFGKLVS